MAIPPIKPSPLGVSNSPCGVESLKSFRDWDPSLDVSNSPCGVEREKLTAFLQIVQLRFLIHRVELKGTFSHHNKTLETLFLIHRVELKVFQNLILKTLRNKFLIHRVELKDCHL